MKKVVIGVGLFLSGVIVRCTSYIAVWVVSNMPNVTVTDEGLLPLISWILILLGAAAVAKGYMEK